MFTSFERRKMFPKKPHSSRRQGSDQLPVDELRAVASLSRMFWCVGSMCLAALCNCLVFCFKFSISRCIFRREVRSIRLWPGGLSITAFSDGFIFEKTWNTRTHLAFNLEISLAACHEYFTRWPSAPRSR